MPKTLKEIAEFLKGELCGDGKVTVNGVRGIEEAAEGELTFIISAKYEGALAKSRASCFLVPRDVKNTFGRNVIKLDAPSMALSKAIELITPDKVPHPKGVHASAVIAKNASVGTNAAVGAYAVIDTGAVIGDNTVIYPFAYIGKNAKIGGDCIIYPHVTIREDIMIGNRVIIHPGSVVGSDGFGYDTKPDGSHAKIPHLGTVVIEDDVEIGACVTIDRARFEKTVIGKGSKIDNLVQIAHNVKIGPYCLIAGQSGISGSSELGRNVVFAGQVGMADHAKLGDFAVAGAKTGIPKKSYPPKTVLFGYPAKPIDKAKEIIASTALLPKLFERVRVLEEKLKKITQK